MSTISPELSRLLHREASTLGVSFLDLAVSGSTPAVEAGTITLLAGGDQNTFEQCVPVYQSISRQWFLIGPGGSGVLMKLVVNLLLGVDMQAIAEAVSLGEHLHINRDVLLDVLSRTAVVAPAFLGKFQKIKNGDYSPEFPLRLMSKDMDLAMDAARSRVLFCLRRLPPIPYSPLISPHMGIGIWPRSLPLSLLRERTAKLPV